MSTVLFILGYGLALPIAFRMGRVVAEQNRLALSGHQLGIIIAAIGWMSKGGLALALLHLVWLAWARIWFARSNPAR